MPTTTEETGIALPPEMATTIRSAVDAGDYASTSEVVREALRDSTLKRSLRKQGIAQLRAAWQEALDDKAAGVPADDVLVRLERKYRALADASEQAAR